MFSPDSPGRFPSVEMRNVRQNASIALFFYRKSGLFFPPLIKSDPLTGRTGGGEVVAIDVGAGVPTSMSLSPLFPPESTGAIVGLLVTGAAVVGPSKGVGIGAADTLKSHSMSPPFSKSSGTQHGQSTKGTCVGVVCRS